MAFELLFDHFQKYECEKCNTEVKIGYYKSNGKEMRDVLCPICMVYPGESETKKITDSAKRIYASRQEKLRLNPGLHTLTNTCQKCQSDYSTGDTILEWDTINLTTCDKCWKDARKNYFRGYVCDYSV